MPTEQTREQWDTRVGFILAAVGSAVGLGNIWRFPYLTAQSGGATFVLLYLLLLFFVGIPVMIGEFVIGRRAKKSPVRALSQPGETNWGMLGYLFVLTGFGILSYYSVVAGWTIRYLMDSASGVLMHSSPDTYFSEVSQGNTALLFHFLFMSVTGGIVLGGVKSGIERSVKLLIPLLFVLMIGLAIWAFYQPGSLEGYSFYLQPDMSMMVKTYSLVGIAFPFVNLNILANAAGQTFFTLSLGMGAMITYASYLPANEDLIEETLIISFSDFFVAFLAGLTVFPIIASFGLTQEIGESTVATLFIAIPKAFQAIGGSWGASLCFVFFACLFLAALTSGISLLEVVTSSMIDEFDLQRQHAVVGSAGAIFLVGIPSAYDLDVLSYADKIAGNLLLMVGGFFLAIYVGWMMRESIQELRRGLRIHLADPWRVTIRYIVPPVMLALIIGGVWDLIQPFI